MKKKRITITLEVETAHPVSLLRKKAFWVKVLRGGVTVVQAQANAIRDRE